MVGRGPVRMYGLVKASSKMVMKDADQPDWFRLSLSNKIRRDALDLVPDAQKLRLPFGGHGPFGAVQLIHCRAADHAVDGVGRGLVNHREMERHAFGVVTYYPAPLQCHRSPPNSGRH